jgi:hypothetical protein
MRTLLTATPLLLGAAVLGTTVLPSFAQTNCNSLWVERNSYYKQAGYCFQTARAISYFGNGGCRVTNQSAVPLSQAAQNRIAQIVRQEKSLGCSD